MKQAKKPFLPRVEHFMDCAGNKRAFELSQGPQTDGVVVTACEIDPLHKPGYEFSTWSATIGDALGTLRLKVKEGISRRHLATDSEHGLEMLTHTLRGLVDSGGLVIDGRHISNDQLLKALSSFEGWAIEIKITDPTI